MDARAAEDCPWGMEKQVQQVQLQRMCCDVYKGHVITIVL